MLLALLHISRRKRITLIIGDYFDTDFLILIRSMKTINFAGFCFLLNIVLLFCFSENNRHLSDV